MGLPIWRDPEEEAAKRSLAKQDAAAEARSPIRRRPSVHGHRSPRLRLPHESSHRPSHDSSAREWRRSERRGVPPISTLLESADRRSAVPPLAPAAPESRSVELEQLDARQRELRHDIAQLTQMQDHASRLFRDAGASVSDQFEPLPDTWALWSRAEREAWIDQRTAQWTRSPSPIAPLAGPSRLRERLRLPRRAEASARLLSSSRPDLHDRSLPRERALPTPPHDATEDADSLFVPDRLLERTGEPAHPLRRSWHPDSPIDGLGDRIRSPTPADGWEIMRSTITPDETLPSAESSFTSAVASHSFGSGTSADTRPERYSSSGSSRRIIAEDANHSDSISSVDSDDLMCNEEEREATAAFALDMYLSELGTSDGNDRVARHRAAHADEGNRFALSDESEFVEVGFRLIQEALDSPEGQTRVFQLCQSALGTRPEHLQFEQWIFAHRRNGDRRTRPAYATDDESPSPDSEIHSGAAHTAGRQVQSQTNDYLARRLTPHSNSASRDLRVSSPPPSYERLGSHPDGATFISTDEPEAHPVSPPSSRYNRRRVADSLLGGDEQDLDGVRRIVEGLAQRDDIPDDWWTSVGLARHLPASRSRVRSERRSILSSDGDRLRSGRIQRRSQSPRL